jgi:hypothetical protein
MELLHEEKMGYCINHTRSRILLGERLNISDEIALQKLICIYNNICKSDRRTTRRKSFSVRKILNDIYKLFFSSVKKYNFIRSHNLNLDDAVVASGNVAMALETARETDFELWCNLFPVFYKPTEILIAFQK